MGEERGERGERDREREREREGGGRERKRAVIKISKFLTTIFTIKFYTA